MSADNFYQDNNTPALQAIYGLVLLSLSHGRSQGRFLNKTSRNRRLESAFEYGRFGMLRCDSVWENRA